MYACAGSGAVMARKNSATVRELTGHRDLASLGTDSMLGGHLLDVNLAP